jgi:hypothetical protein
MFNRPSLAAYEQNIIRVDKLVRTMEMHSHFLDRKRQDARTAFKNMHVLVEYLFKEGIIKEGSTILDHTNGCAKQYWSATVLYCLPLLAASYGIKIESAIGAPGHGKDEVDGLNAMDKGYIKEKMCQAQAAGVDERASQMAAEAMVEGLNKSITEEAARLCSLEWRVQIVKSES